MDCDYDDYCQDPVQDILIEKATMHPAFHRQAKINDIAMLRLVSAVDTSKRNVKTICLPTTADSQIDQIDEKLRSKMTISGNKYIFQLIQNTLERVLTLLTVQERHKTT